MSGEGRRLSRGTAAAIDPEIAEFVAVHYPRLIRLAGLICRDVIDSEDAVQAGLERAWRGRASLRDSSKLASWLDRIVVREAIRLGRDRRSVAARVMGNTEDVEAGLARSSDELGAAVTERASLRRAFEALPAPQRAVIALHLYLGYSVAETADIVGAPLETVRSRLRLARDQLRFQLAPEATP
ncbi:MAG TPA: RNA polymerase sigma factor [Candidatus Limnocylindrales bacterium]